MELQENSKCSLSQLAAAKMQPAWNRTHYGGAFSKLTRLKNLRYEIESLPKMPPIMALIEEAGVSRKEMYRTFNMGVGLCIMAPQSEESCIRSIFKKHKIGSSVIGFVTSGKGVRVKSILV